VVPMIRPVLTLRKKRILIDVDTQKDFFLADGKACVRNHRRVLANIRRVMAWARRDQVRVISTVQCHNPNGHDGDVCLSGTPGVCKVPYTLRNRRLTFDSGDTTDFSRDLLQNNDQIILCKRTPDPFDEPRAERMLTEAKASEFIVIGGSTFSGTTTAEFFKLFPEVDAVINGEGELPLSQLIGHLKRSRNTAHWAPVNGIITPASAENGGRTACDGPGVIGDRGRADSGAKYQSCDVLLGPDRRSRDFDPR